MDEMKLLAQFRGVVTPPDSAALAHARYRVLSAGTAGPGLADQAVRGNRRRAARIRLTGAVGAVALAAAVAITLTTLPGRPPGRQSIGRHAVRLHAQTAAYVLSQAAAAQVNSNRLISVDRDPEGGVTYTDVAAKRQRQVFSRGGLSFQMGTAISGGVYKETDVEYRHHVWSTFTTSSVQDGTPFIIAPFLPFLQTSNNPAVAFRQALNAGRVTVMGHRSLNGHDTILLRWDTPAFVRLGHKIIRRRNLPPASLVWLDARTYLVVQTEQFQMARPGSFTPLFDHVTWLDPIPANLALLTVIPPPGFTKIPYLQMNQKYIVPIS
jgi:hypothetical protein